MRNETTVTNTSVGAIINTTNKNLELIKVALNSHIKQCERLKEPLQNSELQHVNNKISDMQILLNDLG